MHLHDYRDVGRRYSLRLPERSLDPEPIYRFDRQKPQRSAWQRLHVVREAVRWTSGFVLDARSDLGHAYRSTKVARE